jgi:hypothetical protein
MIVRAAASTPPALPTASTLVRHLLATAVIEIPLVVVGLAGRPGCLTQVGCAALDLPAGVAVVYQYRSVTGDDIVGVEAV